MRLGTVRRMSVSRHKNELSKFLLNIVKIIITITRALKILYAINELRCSRSSRFIAVNSLAGNFFLCFFIIYLFILRF